MQQHTYARQALQDTPCPPFFLRSVPTAIMQNPPRFKLIAIENFTAAPSASFSNKPLLATQKFEQIHPF